MGQNASPIISKLGLTMFWNNMWDDKLNFSKKLKEDILINMFLFLIFTGSVYYSNFFFSKSNLYFMNIFYLPHKLEKSTYYNNFIQINNLGKIQFSKPFKLKFKMHYIGKIWILRLQGWLIIIFHLYVPQVIKTTFSTEIDSSNFFKKYKKSFIFKNLEKSFIFKKNSTITCSYLSTFYHWYFFNIIKLNEINDKNSSLTFLY